MSLYPRKLRSISKLEREKKRLLQEQKELARSSFPTLLQQAFRGGKKENESVSELDIAAILDPLIAQLQKDWKKPGSRVQKNATPPAGNKKKNPKLTGRAGNTIKKILWDVIAGYAKWKLAELVVRMLIRQLRPRRKVS